MGKGQIGRPGTANPITHAISQDSRGGAPAFARPPVEAHRPPTSYSMTGGASVGKASIPSFRDVRNPGGVQRSSTGTKTSVSGNPLGGDSKPPASKTDSISVPSPSQPTPTHPIDLSAKPVNVPYRRGGSPGSPLLGSAPAANNATQSAEYEGQVGVPCVPTDTFPILAELPGHKCHSEAMVQLESPSGTSPVMSNNARSGLPPRPKPVSSSESISRPETAMSNYSMQALALGRVGSGSRGERRSGERRRAGASGTSLAPEDDDVDSVDLALLRIRRDNNRCDEISSIDIVNDNWDDNGSEDFMSLLPSISEQQPLKKINKSAIMLKTIGVRDGKKAAARSQTKPSRFGGGHPAQQSKVPGKQKTGRTSLEDPRDDIKGHALASSLSSAPGGCATGATPVAWQRLIRQAAPMVLNLEDLTGSTPEVLEMELGCMSLDELIQLNSRVNTGSKR